MKRKYMSSLTHTQTIAIGFIFIILLGTILLMLPVSTRCGESVELVDAFFTATSATCVTGLVTVDTGSTWSVFGQLVILAMIQVGGLGFVSIGVFFSIYLRRNIGLKERGLIKESVNTLQIGGTVKLVKMIVLGTCFFEAAGALLLSTRFIPRFGFLKGLYFAAFHSISAFCNAGFDLMGAIEPYSSLTHFYNDPVVNITIMLLIVIGGLGFIVWDDIQRHRMNFRRYMLHSKIVISATLFLIFGGAVLFFIFENNKLFSDMSMSGKIFSSFFSSITARTAGFNTVDTAALSSSSKLLTMILMFIGGSPGSTAGGIKTTTIVVMLFFVKANLRKTHGYNIFNRRFDEQAIRKASTVFLINLTMGIIASMTICAIQSIPLEDVLFETFSAIGTVGMSTGITRDFTTVSRIIIIMLMYCGRIGSMTFALSLTEKRKSAPVQQPVEQITIG